MSKETDARDNINALLGDNHEVSFVGNDTTMEIRSKLIDSKAAGDKRHTFKVTTASEALITALANALGSTGFEP